MSREGLVPPVETTCITRHPTLCTSGDQNILLEPLALSIGCRIFDRTPYRAVEPLHPTDDPHLSELSHGRH